MTYIVNTAAGFPENYYPQDVLASNIRRHCETLIRDYCEAEEIDFDTQEIFDLSQIERFFTNVKVGGRYFTLPIDDFDPDDPPGIEETFQKMVNMTLDLVVTTIEKLLRESDAKPEDISLLSTVTVLPAVPSLEARLMSRLPFTPATKRMALCGVGCMGGALGLSRVTDYLEGHPDEAAIVFTTDPSSGLWQGSIHGDLTSLLEQVIEDPSQYGNVIMTLIVAALFGDGVGAVLMAGRNHPLAKNAKLKVIGTRSITLPDTEHLMALPLTDYGFRQVLRPEVSDHVKGGLRQAIDPLLAEHNLSFDDIFCWMVHPGGPKILDAVTEEYGLAADALKVSWEVLADIGNIASATILCILDKTFAQLQPPAGSYGLLVAMGPGFSQEVLLVQW